MQVRVISVIFSRACGEKPGAGSQDQRREKAAPAAEQLAADMVNEQDRQQSHERATATGREFISAQKGSWRRHSASSGEEVFRSI